MVYRCLQPSRLLDVTEANHKRCFRSRLETLMLRFHSMKLIFFDMGLAIESYIGSKEMAIIQHRDAIKELETEKRVTKAF